MEARPTEYRGIVFRSKSEAQLAYMFEHSTLGVTDWIYEPEKFKLPNGYCPDFLIYMKSLILLIEYKPTIPSETYVKTFYERLANYPNELGLLRGGTILYGSVYTDGIYELDKYYKPKRIEAFTRELMEKAKAYRFDLK